MAATFFIDLDGTIFKHGTNDLLPGAQALLDAIVQKGGTIIFTTLRGDKHFPGHKVYSREGAMQGIRTLRVPYETVIFDVDSPRIVINDGGAIGVNHETNGPWLGIMIREATLEGEDDPLADSPGNCNA